MKELWRWSQQKQKDKSRDDLHHELFAGYRRKRSRGNKLKQPTTQHKETRQAKQEECAIITQQRIPQTEMADMRIDHEDHRESSHRIDVFYPFGCHLLLQK